MHPPQLFDSHAHVNFEAFQGDWQTVLDGCQQAGAWTVLVGSQLATSRRAIELAEQYDRGVYAAVGLHALHVADQPVAFNVADYAALAAASKKVVAIGETGVDYYRLPKGQEKETVQLQREVFLAQLGLARERNLALIMHTRERPGGPPAAYADLIAMLKQERSRGLPRGVIHCFLGTLAEAQEFMDLGFYIGITGIVTFAKKADALQRLVGELPLERIVVETDCPYLAPEPHRGERNQPQFVEFVAKKISDLKHLTYETVAQRTLQNACDLFLVG